ncbi:Spo0E family sporulation regulatory protein-aspartic acid phosphatase [Fictibacillus iocasae]|uniref:Spo0E family sporulation regulatory protein-aspartic acid phosphatase n=1 Tax=Fictibacillus iocasae TaxID=2715437 RepID=A0ABW2NP91_9BACL
MNEKQALSLEIVKQQDILAESVERSGLNSTETIQQSQKLDQLITKCQQIKKERQRYEKNEI